MKKEYSVPVGIFVFNRLDLAQKMLECLTVCRPRKLFVISDGPRDWVSGEKEKVEKVRELFAQVSWPCEIYRNYAAENMGCDNRIPSGISWIFEHADEAVILEDDCIPSDDFFPFVEAMLENYRNDEQVMMISGSNQMGAYKIEDACCFSARVYTWGWATWKRAWKHYTEDEKVWDRIKKDGTLAQIYPCRTRYYVKRELDYYFERGKCPWDYLWWISCIACGGLCAVPRVNLISNQGFGEDATHTKTAGNYDGTTGRMEFPLNYPDCVVRNREIDRYDKGLNRPGIFYRLLRKVKHKVSEK